MAKYKLGDISSQKRLQGYSKSLQRFIVKPLLQSCKLFDQPCKSRFNHFTWVCLRGELLWIGQFSVDVPLQEPWILSVQEQPLATLLSSVEGGEVRSDHGKLSHFAGNGVKVDLVRGTENTNKVSNFSSFTFLEMTILFTLFRYRYGRSSTQS